MDGIELFLASVAVGCAGFVVAVLVGVLVDAFRDSAPPDDER